MKKWHHTWTAFSLKYCADLRNTFFRVSETRLSVAACCPPSSQLCWKALWQTDTWCGWLIMLNDTILLHVSLKDPVKLSPWRCEYNWKLLQLCQVLTKLGVSTNQWFGIVFSLDWLTTVCSAALNRWLEKTCCAESDVELYCCCSLNLVLQITVIVCVFPPAVGLATTSIRGEPQVCWAEWWLLWPWRW